MMYTDGENFNDDFSDEQGFVDENNLENNQFKAETEQMDEKDDIYTNNNNNSEIENQTTLHEAEANTVYNNEDDNIIFVENESEHEEKENVEVDKSNNLQGNDILESEEDYISENNNNSKKLPLQEKNLADKINKKNLIRTIIGIIAALIMSSIVLSIVVPKRKNKKEEIDNVNTTHVPEFLKNWKPEPKKDKGISQGTNEKEETKEDENVTIEGIEKKLDDIVENELKPNSTSPVLPPIQNQHNIAVSSRPETNSNEQQKVTMRMKISDNDKSNSNLTNNQTFNNYLQGNTQGLSVYNYNDQIAQRNSMLEQTLQSLRTANGQQVDTKNIGMSNGQINKQNFFNENIDNENKMQFNGEYALWSGTIISAILETAISTDNPGVVVARVTSNVYSSQNGKHLLIPQGTLLFATYNSSISYGQDRVQVGWNKMIRPDGFEMDLGNLNGVDKQGMSGVKGKVNNHFWETAKALGLIAMFSTVNTKIEMQKYDNLYTQYAVADVYKQIQEIEKGVLDRALDIQPTITIPQKTIVNIITNKTLDIPPFENFSVTQRYVRTR